VQHETIRFALTSIFRRTLAFINPLKSHESYVVSVLLTYLQFFDPVLCNIILFHLCLAILALYHWTGNNIVFRYIVFYIVFCNGLGLRSGMPLIDEY